MNEIRYNIDNKKYSLIGSRWYDNAGNLITNNSVR
jgi:hypothetical protein